MDIPPKEKTMELQEHARESQRIGKLSAEPLSRDIRSVMRALGAGAAFSEQAREVAAMAERAAAKRAASTATPWVPFPCARG